MRPDAAHKGHYRRCNAVLLGWRAAIGVELVQPPKPKRISTGDRHMRRVLLGSLVVGVSMLPHLAGAGPKMIHVDPSNSSDQPQAATGVLQDYRGYRLDRSENTARKELE